MKTYWTDTIIEKLGEAGTSVVRGEPVRVYKADETDRENKELLDTLCDVVNQACRQGDGTIDSFALSAYAYGMHVLEEHGRLKIKKEAGRRVIGEFIKEEGRK